VNYTPIQNYLTQKATDILSKKLKTTVQVAHVRIDFLNHLLIQGLYIEGQQHDTLLYAGELQVRITDWFILNKGKNVIKYVGLKDAYAHIYRTRASDVWNYEFIANAFNTGSKDTTSPDIELGLEKISIKRTRFHSDDAWGGNDADIDVGNLDINGKQLDSKKKTIDINNIDIQNTLVVVNNYRGGKPHDTAIINYSEIFDTTAFNPAKWVVSCNKLLLDKCTFRLNQSDKPPVVGEFDPDHIYINDINLSVNKVHVVGDTIRGRIAHLTAKDRSGVMIKEMRSDVSVSPIASICSNLYLETNNSKVYDYYAMLYRHFPDFLDYNNKVTMVGHVHNASVDIKDVAYFAPALHIFPPVVLKVNTNTIGTVAKLDCKDIVMIDGDATLKGNLTMTGLPDVYKTYFDFQNGEVVFNAASIYKYAPALKDNPNIDIDKITHASYRGNYVGFIENFSSEGVLATNLGTVVTNTKFTIPIQTKADIQYSGTVSADTFNIGVLFKQPNLRTVTFKADVEGNGVDFNDGAQIKIKSNINQFELKDYNYKNIYADGIVAKRRFDGNLKINDPNLGIIFNGYFDFSDKNNMIVNARANLLNSDFKALHLFKDSFTAIADFDLNCAGKSIDDFTGYAKLNNINISRNHHRLNLDSVLVTSSEYNRQKWLVIESNALTARIKGNYELSKLGLSMQYYLSGYLPNYIEPPKNLAPEQNITFEVTTKEIDSLLGVVIPMFRGFNHATLKGTLSTIQQTLALNVKVPHGTIGNAHMNNIAITGDGNYKKLSLNMSVDEIRIGDSLLNVTMSAKTTIGNDSFRFNINTETPESYGTASINGEAYTHNDSLYLTFAPSDFYLDKNKWEIPTGSNIILSTDYLFIRNLFLQSGNQKISVNTQNENTKHSVGFAINNVEILPLSNIAGIASYRPDGILSGDIGIDDIFNKPIVNCDVRATHVICNGDTIGNIMLAGNYNTGKKEITLEKKSGIYLYNSSLTLSGNMLLDSTSDQKIEGNIYFDNAPVAWVNPYVHGYVSGLKGTVKGAIQLSGTASNPKFDGSLSLRDACVHVDYLGTTYTVPSAILNIKNKKIEIGSMAAYDVYKNKAEITGEITHKGFTEFALNLALTAPKLEVFNLTNYDNKYFYGNLIAEVQEFTVKGPIENIVMNATGSPADKSHIYIPVTHGGDVSEYNYVTFKSYKVNKTKNVKAIPKTKYKLAININANVTPQAEVTLLLDPASGGDINAKGYCNNLQMNITMGGDFRMYGNYIIDEGDYTFKLKQLAFVKNFLLNSGSEINFNGPLSSTNLAINATYSTKARLYDLLSESELSRLSGNEPSDAKAPQKVNVLLHMNGNLQKPEFTYNIELSEKRSIGTYAYSKLEHINQSDRDLIDQVGALLLIGAFIPPDGLAGATAGTGAVSNASDYISSSVSSQLTNIMNKIIGDKKLSLQLNYKSYNLSDPSAGSAINRNELKIGLQKKFFDDRFVIDFGSVYDWGKPTTASSNAAGNLAGDFRAQYLLTQDGRVRLNAFYTSDYDALQYQTIQRNGIGISWRKSFDSFSELVHGAKYLKIQEEKKTDTTSAKTNDTH
jgi:hypothetical protein